MFVALGLPFPWVHLSVGGGGGGGGQQAYSLSSKLKLWNFHGFWLVPYNYCLSLLLLSVKYFGFSSLQLGHGFFLPNLFKHFLQSSLPHSPCCHGSSATSRQIRHSRSSSGSDIKLYLSVLLSVMFVAMMR